MLNQNALKMVGPTFEEVGVKTKGTISPASTPLSILVSVAYSPVVSMATVVSYHTITSKK